MGTKRWTWRKKAGAALSALGLMLATVGALGNPSAADHTDGSAWSTPDEGVTITPDTESCNGIIPTPGSENTEKTLTGGTLLPGGTATFQIDFPHEPGADGDWEIADCLLAGSGPDLKQYEVLDHATFNGAANDQVFFLTIDYQIPEDVPLGTRICNVAKTTESPSAAQGSNRKAGPACFTVGGDQQIEKRDAETGDLIPDDNPATFLFTDCVTTAEDPSLQPLVISWFDENSDPQSAVLDEDNPELADVETEVTANRIGLNGPSGSTCDVTETEAPEGYTLPEDPGPFTITISPGTGTTEPLVFNDPPVEPALEITKTALDEDLEISEDESVDFSIVVENTGDTALTDLMVTDELADHVEWSLGDVTIDDADDPEDEPTVLDDPNPCVLDEGVDPELECDLGLNEITLAVGEQLTISLTADTAEGDCRDIDNTAVAEAEFDEETDEADLTDSDASETVTVSGCDFDLDITKTALDEDLSIVSGESVGLSIVVENTGDFAIEDLLVTDELADHVGWSLGDVTVDDADDPEDEPTVLDDPNPCVLDEGVDPELECDLGLNEITLAVGEQLTISLTADTAEGDCRDIDNTAVAEAQFDEETDEADLTDSDASETVEVTGCPDGFIPPPGPSETTTTTEGPGPVVLPTEVINTTTTEGPSTTVEVAPTVVVSEERAPPTTARVLGRQLARTGAGSNTLLVLGGLVLVLGGMALTFGEPQVSRRRG